MAENDIVFYVHLSNEEYPAIDGSIIQYDVVVTNLGNGYNTASGSFTALQHGYYVFNMFFITVSGTDSDVYLMINDNPVCVGNAPADASNQGMCTCVSELQVGDVANVKASGDVLLGGSGRGNGFSGYIYKAL